MLSYCWLVTTDLYIASLGHGLAFPILYCSMNYGSVQRSDLQHEQLTTDINISILAGMSLLH